MPFASSRKRAVTTAPVSAAAKSVTYLLAAAGRASKTAMAGRKVLDNVDEQHYFAGEADNSNRAREKPTGICIAQTA